MHTLFRTFKQLHRGGFIILAGALCPWFAASATEQQQPNFIVILTDDQGWAGTDVPMDPSIEGSSHSFFHTPNLGRLADIGLRFARGYSSAPKCAPARAGLLTGQTPARLRFTENSDGESQAEFSKKIEGAVICQSGYDNLKPDAMTIGEWFKLYAPEYTTAHFGKWHVGASPSERGFDINDGPNGNAEGNFRTKNKNNFKPEDPKWVYTLTERANNFLREQAASNKPFYLQVSHYAVHLEEYANPTTVEAIKARGDVPEELSPTYVGMTEDLDTSLGLLLDEVARLGLLENTYIFYISDNGAEREIANGPLAGKKRWNWEGGIRVPYIVAGPTVPKGAVTQTPAAGFDIFPTVCDLVGHADKIPTEVDGGSLRAVFSDPISGTVKRHFDGLFFHVGRYFKNYLVTPHSAIILGDYKFILEYDSKDRQGSKRWLYNIKEDIGEQHNLIQSMPERAIEMERQLMARLHEVDAEIPAPNPNYSGPNPYVPLQ